MAISNGLVSIQGMVASEIADFNVRFCPLPVTNDLNMHKYIDVDYPKDFRLYSINRYGYSNPANMNFQFKNLMVAD